MADLKPAYLLHGDDEASSTAWRRAPACPSRDRAGPRRRSRFSSSGDPPHARGVVGATAALTLSVGGATCSPTGPSAGRTRTRPVVEALEAPSRRHRACWSSRGKVTRGAGPAPDALVKAVGAIGGEVLLCAAPTPAKFPRMDRGARRRSWASSSPRTRRRRCSSASARTSSGSCVSSRSWPATRPRAAGSTGRRSRR